MNDLENEYLKNNLQKIGDMIAKCYGLDDKKYNVELSKAGNVKIMLSGTSMFVFGVEQTDPISFHFEPKNKSDGLKAMKVQLTKIPLKELSVSALLADYPVLDDPQYTVVINDLSESPTIEICDTANNTKDRYEILNTDGCCNFYAIDSKITNYCGGNAEKIKACLFEEYPLLEKHKAKVTIVSLTDIYIHFAKAKKGFIVKYRGLDKIEKNKELLNELDFFEEESLFCSQIEKTKEVASKVYAERYPYAETPKNVVFQYNQDICCITIVTEYEDYDISIKPHLFRVKTPEESFVKFLTVFEATFADRIKNHIPTKVSMKLKRAMKAVPTDKDTFIQNATLLDSFQERKKSHVLAVIGSSIWKNVADLNKTIKKESTTISFDTTQNLFVVTTFFYNFYFDTSFKFVRKEERKEKVDTIRESFETAKAGVPYYSVLLSFFSEVEEKEGCAVTEMPDYTGICNGPTTVSFNYFGKFTVPFDFPSISSFEGKTEKEIKKELNPLLKEKVKEIKKEMKENEKRELERKREDKYLFQSFAAKTIYDFLLGEKTSFSESTLVSYLTSGKENGYSITKEGKKYSKKLSEYKKDYLKTLIYKMSTAGLLKSTYKSGTYCDYEAYSADTKSGQHDFYFNSYTRTKTEIKKDLKEGKSVSLSESLLMLKEMKEGKVKEKDMACLFNLLRNYEFVLNYQKEIKEAFACLPPNVLLYIPFIIDEFEPRSLEKKILNEMIPKKRKKKEEVV